MAGCHTAHHDGTKGRSRVTVASVLDSHGLSVSRAWLPPPPSSPLSTQNILSPVDSGGTSLPSPGSLACQSQGGASSFLCWFCFCRNQIRTLSPQRDAATSLKPPAVKDVGSSLWGFSLLQKILPFPVVRAATALPLVCI